VITTLNAKYYIFYAVIFHIIKVYQALNAKYYMLVHEARFYHARGKQKFFSFFSNKGKFSQQK